MFNFHDMFIFDEQKKNNEQNEKLKITLNTELKVSILFLIYST